MGTFKNITMINVGTGITVAHGTAQHFDIDGVTAINVGTLFEERDPHPSQAADFFKFLGLPEDANADALATVLSKLAKAPAEDRAAIASDKSLLEKIGSAAVKTVGFAEKLLALVTNPSVQAWASKLLP